MKPFRISAVSYYNTLPFIHGLKNSGLLKDFELNLDVPSECARKLRDGEADIALVPVGALPGIPGHRIIGDTCIGAVSDVKSVLLLGNTPLGELTTVYLDPDSRTSVSLVKVLARKYWKISPEWKELGNLRGELGPGEAQVLIGDKTFGLCRRFSHCYDLAGEWIRFTGLPFVFAVWVSVRELPENFEKNLNAALNWGIGNREGSIYLADRLHISEQELDSYLRHDISYELDDRKKQGIDLFLGFLNENPQKD